MSFPVIVEHEVVLVHVSQVREGWFSDSMVPACWAWTARRKKDMATIRIMMDMEIYTMTKDVVLS